MKLPELDNAEFTPLPADPRAVNLLAYELGFGSGLHLMARMRRGE